MLATTFLLFINVTLRYLFQGLFWVEEVLRYLFVWITFIGAATCVRQKAHISLDTLVLPAAFQAGPLSSGRHVVGSPVPLTYFYSLRFVLAERRPTGLGDDGRLSHVHRLFVPAHRVSL